MATTRKKTTTKKKTTAKKSTVKKKTTRKKTTRKKATRKYSRAASHDVEEEMREFNAGKLRSGRSGKKVTSRKQAIAIGLSKARSEGKRVPKAPSRKKKR